MKTGARLHGIQFGSFVFIYPRQMNAHHHEPRGANQLASARRKVASVATQPDFVSSQTANAAMPPSMNDQHRATAAPPA